MVVKHPSLASPQLVTFVVTQWNTESLPTQSVETLNFEHASIAEEIRQRCGGALPNFMVPNHIVRLTSVPRASTSRKTESKRLEMLFRKLPITALAFSNKLKLPSTRSMSELEKSVRNVAADILAIDPARIALDTNLFCVGLDSLNVIDLAMKLQTSGFQTIISELLRKPNVRQIALLKREDLDRHTNSTAKQRETLKQQPCFDVTNGVGDSGLIAFRPCLPL